MKNDRLKFKNIFLFCIATLIFAFLIFNFVYAATNIYSADNSRHAWNDMIGWVDFGYSAGNVNVSSIQLSGYASSSVSFIALDCATTPNGNICSGGAGDWKVTNNGSGNLSGWAYNDAIGWVSFDSATAGSGIFYQVSINSLTGDFYGWAWNDIVGWISFNCNNTFTCGASDYKVKTAWRSLPSTGSLESSIFDTQVAGGSTINTLMWKGTQPSGTSVRFQIASSNSSAGPWNYIGPDGASATFYQPTGSGIPVQINLQYHSNQRYMRYKVFLESNAAQTASPQIENIIINWSP